MLAIIPAAIILVFTGLGALMPVNGFRGDRAVNSTVGGLIGAVAAGFSILFILSSANLLVVSDKQDLVAIDDNAYLVIDQENVATFQTPGFNYTKSDNVERVTYDGDPYVETIAYCATMLPNWNMCDPSRDAYRVYLDPETVKVAG